MKLEEYCQCNWIPDRIRIDKYLEFLISLTSKNSKYVKMPLDEDFLEKNKVQEYLTSYKDKVVCICSGDIDFPPPKYPYKYDRYFSESILPKNYKQIPYSEKIDMEVMKIIEKNNLFVVSQDISVWSPRLLCMPIGSYLKWNTFDNDIYLRRLPKINLCYANFGIPWVEQWFGRPRLEVYSLIQDKEFILIENTGNNECRNTSNLNDFYKKIASSKFAICPRGLGIDTYRLWDCIYLGCIPIVEKYDGHKEFEDLPILFIDSFDFYKDLTEEKLNTIYNDMLQRDYNYEKLSFSYWISRIESLQEKLGVSI